MVFLEPRDKTVEFEGESGAKISMTLIRPAFAHAQELMAVYQRAFVELASIDEQASMREQGLATAAFVEAIPPPFVEAMFALYVKDVTGFETDEGPVTLDGAALLVQAPDNKLVVFVLTALKTMCKLGKAKSSRSSAGSTREESAVSSPSNAPTIASDSETPSTATATAGDPVPSSAEA